MLTVTNVTRTWEDKVYLFLVRNFDDVAIDNVIRITWIAMDGTNIGSKQDDFLSRYDLKVRLNRYCHWPDGSHQMLVPMSKALAFQFWCLNRDE